MRLAPVGLGFAQRGAFGMAGDVVVAGLAMQHVGVEDYAARGRRRVDARHARALVVAAAGAQLRTPGERLVGGGFRDTAIHHVDCAADGATAVQQRGRALQHLDLLGKERLDGHRVVHADRGHVSGGQPVAEDLHARAVQAADDRAADAGTEVRGLHARQAADGFAQRVGLGLVQPGAREDLDRSRQVFRGLRQRHRAHHDAGQVLDLVVAGVLLREAGAAEREQQGAGEGGGEQACGAGGRHVDWRPWR